VLKMAVKFNEDKSVVERIKKGLKEKEGFCPCKLGKLPENKCMCEEFKSQIKDPEFEGYCHCMLYYKSKD
jgi:ferredoxin-thioredoxin reductase catalytic subunit